MTTPKIHRITDTALGITVNAYIVESHSGLVLIDGGFSVAHVNLLRQRAADLGKRFFGAIVTHGHPDHFIGVGHVLNDASLPIHALPNVVAQARAREVAEIPSMRALMGDEMPFPYRLPDHPLADGERLVLGDLRFRIHDFGAGESDCDGVAVLEDTNGVFCGDVVYSQMHLFLKDGHTQRWLGNLDRLANNFPAHAVFYPGHGDPGGRELIAFTRDYLTMARQTVAGFAGLNLPINDEKARFVDAITRFLPHGGLLDLAQYELDQTLSALANDLALH